MRRGTRITHEKTQERTPSWTSKHSRGHRTEDREKPLPEHLPPATSLDPPFLSCPLIDQNLPGTTALSEKRPREATSVHVTNLLCEENNLHTTAAPPVNLATAFYRKRKVSDATTLRCAMRERKCMLPSGHVLELPLGSYLSVHLQRTQLTRSDARTRAKCHRFLSTALGNGMFVKWESFQRAARQRSARAETPPMTEVCQVVPSRGCLHCLSEKLCACAMGGSAGRSQWRLALREHPQEGRADPSHVMVWMREVPPGSTKRHTVGERERPQQYAPRARIT